MDIRNEIRHAQDDTYKKSPSEVAFSLGAKALVGIATGKAASSLPTGIPIDKLKYINEFTIQGQPWMSKITRKTRSASLKEVAWELTKWTEEAMFKIPRTFSLSSIVGKTIFSQAELDIAANSEWFRQNVDYLDIISEGKINRRNIRHGIGIRRAKGIFGNRLSVFELDEAGNVLKDKVLLKHAHILPGMWGSNFEAEGLEGGYTSRFVKGLFQQHDKLKGAIPDSDFVITGGNKWIKSASEQFGAYATVTVQNYMKLMDDPFEVLRQTIGKGPVGEKIFNSGSKFLDLLTLKDQFGVGGYQFMKSGNWKQLLGRHFTRSMPKLALLYGGYKLIDAAFRQTPGIRDTELGSGVPGIFAKLFQKSTKAYAHISDATGLTAISKAQEEAAPGSTKKSAHLGFAAAGAIFGGTVGGMLSTMDVYKGKLRVGDVAGIPKPLFNDLHRVENAKGALGEAFSKLNISGKGRTGAFATIGAVAGLVLTSPFWLGALGSNKSAEELDNIYSGKEKVAIRRGRFWEAGISPFEGEDIEHFAPHWTVRALTDARQRGILPEDYYRNPIKHLLNRLVDPYTLERKLDEERPYKYWGPSDIGLGLAEVLAAPIKRLIKPIKLAHPEASQGAHPSQLLRYSPSVPASMEGSPDAITTGGYIPITESPSSFRSWLSQATASTQTMAGIHGFVASGLTQFLSGGQSFLTPNAMDETSGRIQSAQRAFWDASIGGAGATSEAYRRLNPDRPYSTEFISAPIRNKMPDWIPDRLKFGDPYAQISMGEMRLPGRGYSALYPEVKGLDADEYPLVHKMNILNDVDPSSASFYGTKALVEQQIAEGGLNEGGVNLYNEIMRQREVIKEDTQFDTGSGILGEYYRALKETGRALPTEALYPFSPVHKFAGPVSPESHYKSYISLDKQFKLWQHPVSDFAKPAFNRVVDAFSLTPYTPPATQEYYGIENYFNALQSRKNQVLEEKANAAKDAGDYDIASFYRSGRRRNLYDTSVYEDIDNIASMLPDRQRRYIQPFVNMDRSKRQDVYNMVSPEMQQVLQGQWTKYDLLEAGEFNRLEQLEKRTERVTGNIPDSELEGQMPNEDWIGYAPGVNLNAFKLKTVHSMGKNIRDFGMWREDERQAQILDAVLMSKNIEAISTNVAPGHSDISRRALEKQLAAIGMRGAQVVASPVGGNSMADLNLKPDNRKAIYDKMREENMVAY